MDRGKVSVYERSIAAIERIIGFLVTWISPAGRVTPPTAPPLPGHTSGTLVRTVWLAALVALLTPTAASAQASVNGFVRDAASGETLVGATVLLDGLGRGVATNTQGFFAVGDLPAGDQTLVVSFVGFDTQRVEVTLADGQTRRVEVELAPAGVTGAEVTVEATERIEEERGVGVQDIPIRLVQDLPTVFEADLFRSIQLLPGVKSSSDFSSALYIRGGSPDQTLILLDGTTVYNPTHFFGFFSTFNTDAIKDVRLYKGAYPSTYGGRLGSVIDIYNRDGNRKARRGTATVGILASRVGVEGPLAGGRVSYSLNARRSTLEPLLAVLRENLDVDGIPNSFYFYDLNAKVSADLGPNDRVSVAAYAGRDKVTLELGDDAAFDLDYGNRTASLAYNRVLTGTSFLQTRATASRYFSYPEGNFAGTTFERPNTITDYSLRTDLEWRPSEAYEVAVGAWGGTLGLGLSSAFNGSTQTDYRNPSRYGSAYAQAKVRPGGGVILTGGLRAETFRSETDDLTDDLDPVPATFTRLAPQVQVERTFGPSTVVQLAAGRYNQFLSLISNEAFSGFDTWVTTGVGVPPQESDQLVLGYKTKLSPTYRLDVEVYGRTLRDLFDNQPANQDVAGLSYAELFRFGDGYAYGAEVLLERGLGRLTGLVGYTFGVTRRRYPDEPAFQDYFAPKYDRTHDVSIVANYDLGRGWRATAAAAYATGQAFTTPSALYVVDGGPLDRSGFGVLQSNGLNTARLPDYHRVDVGFTRKGSFFGAASELQLQLINVYNRRNLWFKQYDFDDNPVTVSDVKQLPILPNVALTLDF